MTTDTGYRDAIQSADDLTIYSSAMDANNIPHTWSGLCLWIDLDPADMTGKQVQALHLLGARYSGKRNRYYLRSNGTIPRSAA